ncbi:MAG: hypothetical protein ACO25K_06910, partial [Candidatus Fonsibacter ubiquis]
MRIIFTIIFNGLHHLTHNNQAEFILNNCDKWVVVEGASQSTGSTSWCKKIPDTLHNNGASVDGTREFLTNLAKATDKIIYVPSNGFWNSKDHQVNRAIDEVKKITDKCFLWEFDIDEQWTSEAMDKAEKELVEKNAKTGSFLANCYVGKNIKALGEWGECSPGGYTRLWNWSGEYFSKHEPPTLEGGNGLHLTLTPKFNHYNYYFEQDVKFKNDWYGGHEGIYERWKLINSLPDQIFPLPISALIT